MCSNLGNFLAFYTLLHSLQQSNTACFSFIVMKQSKRNDLAPTDGKSQSGAEPEVPKTVMIENYLQSMYEFRYNEVNGKFEFTPLESALWRPVDKMLINSVRRELNNAGSSLKCSRDQLESIIESSFSPVRNPIKEYFSSLIVTDGESNIDKLLSTVKVTNTETWKTCMTKWLVAVVANALDDNRCCNHTCLVLAGAQGIGKTTWLNYLCPQRLSKDYLYIGKFNPDNKDALRLVAERLLVNIDDQLQNINRVDEDKIKAILTQKSVSYRKPYDVNVLDYPHRASFMASVNSSEYLTDSTGSRRFLSFNVESVSTDEQKEVNMDLVYGECLGLLRSGYHYWFEGEEIAQLENENQAFMMNSMEYELLTQLFNVVPPEMEAEYTPLTSTQIFHFMESATASKLNFTKLCKGLKRMVREQGLVYKSFRQGSRVLHGYVIQQDTSFNLAKCSFMPRN